MIRIKDKLLKLNQDINSVGTSFPMLYVKLDFIEKMEFEQNENVLFKETLENIDTLLNKAQKNIEDYNSLIEIKNLYSEAYIYSKLKSLLIIDKIPEGNSKTPDYKVRFREEDIYIELKSLNMLGGNLKHKVIMTDSLDAKIEAEDQIRSGSNVGFGEQEIQPYLNPNKEYDPRSVRLVTESLIDKINQNIKREQYSLGPTILLVDLADQLPFISSPSQAMREHNFDDIGQTNVSGELWNVAFGNVGDKISKPAEFEGADSNDGNLSKEGILVSHSYIKGIIFHVNDNFYSLAEITKENTGVVHLLEYVSKQCSRKI